MVDESPARRALFINGVYDGVLREIVTAQEREPGLDCYLQPYSSSAIAMLRNESPSKDDPVELFVSTTDQLSTVRYRALIVGWSDKRNLAPKDMRRLNAHMAEHQPGEQEVYLEVNGTACVNLLTASQLEEIEHPLPTSTLVKTSDGVPLKPRTRAGGWSYVLPMPRWFGRTRVAGTDEYVRKVLEQGVAKARKEGARLRRERLATASRLPERVQVIATTFVRNPDVIAEVLERAGGECERCGKDAPFTRASNGTPYLEVHHTQPLAQGGEDVVENAVALCPNCHREVHFG